MKRAVVVLLPLMGLLAAAAADPVQPPVGGNVNTEKVTFRMQFTVTATPGLQQTTLTAIVPKTLPQRQKVLSLTYSTPPSQEFDADGVHYAQFTIDNPPPKTVITIDGQAEAYRFDFNAAKAVSPANLENAQNLQPWLADEKYLEKNAPEVQKAAAAIAGSDDVTELRNIMAFVTKTLRESGFSSADRGALWALEHKNGDCTEFADLFVALCRAKNIPARYCEGYLVGPLPSTLPAAHNWAEAYTKEYGWVRFDPIHTRDRSATFDSIKPEYLQLSNIRNDPTLVGSHYYRWTWQGSGNVKVDSHFTVTHRESLVKK
jgi:transglutaminase-like putative cysteine protease